MGSLTRFWICGTLASLLVAKLVVRKRTRMLKVLVGVASGTVAIGFLMKGDYSYPAIGRFSKVMCTAALGLETILAYMDMPEEFQKTHLRGFTNYVNAAVVGNIAMMVFIPYHGSVRESTGRVACGLLTVWLLQEMHRVQWKTIDFDTGAFVFHSLPMSWVWAHTAYRLILLTSPAFDSLKYVLLEPVSLSLMYTLRRTYDPNKSRPLSHFFGFADTITAATLALTSALVHVDTDMPLTWSAVGVDDKVLDLIGVPIQVGVACFAATHVWWNLFPTQPDE